MKHIHTMTAILAIVFSGAIIGLNIYSMLGSTSWYELGNSHLTWSLNRGQFNGEYSSKTRQTMYVSFGFTLVSCFFVSI
ncbi:hypothetical protein SAMD00019534_041380, partial [Acytostelium subglobosum LB1]|uniref:hypothetical protein n=1 Tax=Acytostelium subglobosum LB1 TaxID=1410327 RepID=UPI000644EE2E